MRETAASGPRAGGGGPIPPVAAAGADPFSNCFGWSDCMRILVVEDDLEAQRYLVNGLKEAGHVVDDAADGETGLTLALSRPYDVAIIDRMLPKIDGLKVVADMREHANVTPVLFLSALSEVDDRVKGLKAGGDDYLTKLTPSSNCSRA
jgi:DNA-binding response OmpR family regulator